MRHADLAVGAEIRRLRLDAGVTLAELARLVDVHPSHIGRIEAAATHPSLAVLTAIGVALGADLSLRFFSGSGPRIRDRFQAPMIEDLLGRLDTRWDVRPEVPVRTPSRGVIDLVLIDRTGSTVVAVEAHSQIRSLEEQLRWAAEKAVGLTRQFERDGHGRDRPVSRLLLLRSTVRTRDLATRFRSTLAAAYPARTASVVEALTSTRPWPGDGIVWMQATRRGATLMRFPPRGVDLGR
jgi:transcriptional regulator with XRE-family HTH domain